MTKKLISIMLTLAMVFSIGIMPETIFAQKFSDITSNSISEAASVLSDLGIMSGFADGTFLPDSTITRSEMVRYCVALVSAGNVPSQASDEDDQFIDMYGHADSGVVAMAYSLGIVAGDGSGYFNPDVSISGEEAIKMVVSTLGYGLYAQSKGGYPGGYMRVAQESGLLRGASTEAGQNATRGFVAKLLFNALTVDLMEDAYYTDGGNTTAFTITSGKNVLTKYFNIETLRGIVEETSQSTLVGDGELQKGLVKIGDEIFNTGLTGISNYLGYYVSFYALDAKDNRYRTVISFNVENVRNNLITLDAENIERVTSSVNGYTFEYWKDKDNDSKTKTVKTSTMPLVIYNGVAYTEAVESDLMPEYGKVTLIDNDGDNKYDIVDVTSYKYVFVTSVSATNGVVSGFNHETYYLNLDDEDVTVKITDSFSQPTTAASIIRNSVVAIAESKNGLAKSVIVANSPVNGTISEIDESEDAFVINGTSYKLVRGVCTDLDLLEVGDGGIFYLTHDGRIAGFDGSRKISNNIGVFVARGDEGGGDYKFKVYTPSGEFKTLYLASRVEVDDVMWSAADIYAKAFSNELFGLDSNSSQAGRQIPDREKSCFIYKLDSNGKIKMMQTARGTHLRSYRPSDADSSYYYSKVYQCFYIDDKKTYVSDNLVVFWQDEKESYGKDYTKAFGTRALSSFSNAQSFYYTACIFYFYEGSESADILMCYDPYDAEGTSGDKKWYSNETIKVVDHMGTAINKLGNTSPKLYYWEGTSLKSRIFESEDVAGATSLKKGDLIHIRDYDGQIVEIAHVDTNSNTSAWNSDPPAIDGNTGKYFYKFPIGRFNWNRPENQWNWGDLYYFGLVTGVNKVNKINTIDILYSTASTAQSLAGMSPTSDRGTDAQSEILETNAPVYRMKYRGDGLLSGIEKVTSGALAAGQIVLIRKQGYKTNNVTGSISCRMKEAYILYENAEEMEYYSDIVELAKDIK